MVWPPETLYPPERFPMVKHRTTVWLLAACFFAANLAIGLRIGDWNFIDENTYGAAAVDILQHQSCTIYALRSATLCNYEHPPLAKALGAVSLYIFGWIEPSRSVFEASYFGTLENLSSSPLWFLAFRFFPLLMGALSLVLLYVAARRISGNSRLALTASCLLVLEPLFSFFSRTDYLEIPMIFFALCAYAVYFAEFRFGPINRFVLSGILLALSALSKETGVVFAVPLLVYHLLFGGSSLRSRLNEVLAGAMAMVVTGVVGLQLYDTLAATPFPTFISQIQYMLEYARSIACPGSCLFNPGPTSWFTFFIQTRWSDGFSGNQVLLWLVFAWVPLGVYTLWMSRRQPVGPDDRLFIFSLLLFCSTLAENELLYLWGRKTWIYFYLTLVPSLALGGAYFITRPQLARWMRWIVVLLLLVGYVWAYVAGPSFLMYS